MLDHIATLFLGFCFNKFIFIYYLFIYLGCAGSSLRRVGFSRCGAPALECAGSVVAACGLSCGVWDVSSLTRDRTRVGSEAS